MDCIQCFYEIFNLDYDDFISRKELEKLRRKYVLKLHPDKWEDGNASEFTKTINRAYDIIIKHINADPFQEGELDHNCDDMLDKAQNIFQALNIMNQRDNRVPDRKDESGEDSGISCDEVIITKEIITIHSDSESEDDDK